MKMFYPSNIQEYVQYIIAIFSNELLNHNYYPTFYFFISLKDNNNNTYQYPISNEEKLKQCINENDTLFYIHDQHSHFPYSIEGHDSPRSCRSHAGLVITSFYPHGESLQLIIAQSMGKAVIFHTTHSILLLKKDSNCLVISETLHREQDANSSLPSDRLRRYHRATKQCISVACVSFPSQALKMGLWSCIDFNNALLHQFKKKISSSLMDVKFSCHSHTIQIRTQIPNPGTLTYTYLT